MKKGKHYRKEPKKVRLNKALLLGAVSLLLVAMMAVTSTVSWIEDVSQVEFSSTDGQETPLHIGSKILLSDATMMDSNDTVDLNKYFNKSGDMHLSPCFGDGENFYFPVQNGTGYRIGTKDDANVNYLSVTFRVISEGAATAYWFEKTGSASFVTFKKGDAGVSGTGLEQQLRCSVTVDGVTNVYAFDDGDQTNGYQKNITPLRLTTARTRRPRKPAEALRNSAITMNGSARTELPTRRRTMHLQTGELTTRT